VVAGIVLLAGLLLVVPYKRQVVHSVEDAERSTRPAILLLVSPVKRRVELVTSTEVQGRLSDAVCTEVVAGMTAHFGRSDIAGGIIAGIHRLQTAVGPSPGEPSPDIFPDLIED